MSRLRGHLGEAAEVLETRSAGYRLVLEPDELDVTHARTMLAAAQRDPVDAYIRLQQVHGLWRGTVLADAGGEAAYQRGDYRRAEMLARAGLEQAGATRSWQCLFVLAVAALARGAFGEVVEHAFAAGDLVGPGREDLGKAALAAAYAGDLPTAREFSRRGTATAVSPSMRAWAAYVEGEIEGCAHNPEEAETNYLQAVYLARASGATFLVGIATVGLLSTRARAGRIHEALSGYRDVVEYFARNGRWTQLWTTLRNLADLLRRLGDGDAAALIESAADRAPDAPAVAGSAPSTDPSVPPLGREAVLDVARQAIARQLTPR